MSNERKYHIIAIVELKNLEIKTLQYDAWFSTDTDDYGNGTYLSIGDDLYYDLRYETDYDSKRELLYLTKWASERWTGENGSRKLICIQVQHIAPLTSL